MLWKLPLRKSIACVHTNTAGSRLARWGPGDGRRHLNPGRNICGGCSVRVNFVGIWGEALERADVRKDLINNGQERGQAEGEVGQVFLLLYLPLLAVTVAGEPTGENKVTAYFFFLRCILRATHERIPQGWLWALHQRGVKVGEEGEGGEVEYRRLFDYTVFIQQQRGWWRAK